MDNNKLLKAIAVDDEKDSLDTLSWELSRSCPEVELIHKLSDELVAKELIPKADFDILFMDIHLQKMSGLELIQSLQPLDCHVIFITAYDEYAIKAFELDAIHYLLKPINSVKLRSAIDRILDKINEAEQISMENLLKAFEQSKHKHDKIPFSVQTGIEFIDPKDITHVKGENNYSILYLISGNKLVISKTLGIIEKLLSDYGFVRIHKSYLLNLKHIIRYVKADGGYIEVEGGHQLSVSRSNRSSIKELFK